MLIRSDDAANMMRLRVPVSPPGEDAIRSEDQLSSQLAQSKLPLRDGPCHVTGVVARVGSELAWTKVVRPQASSWSAKLKLA